MTAEQQTQASEENVEKVQAGTLLKNKREQLGLSQKQIADRLRLRLSIIENIEDNNFASDQVATFTRGYLRSYAKAVGLEESEVLCALDGCDETTKPEAQEMKSFSRKTKREAHDSRIMTLTWGIFAVIIGISSVWWWQNQETSMVDLTSQTEQELELEQQATSQELDFTTLEGTQAQSGVEVESQSNDVEVPVTSEEAVQSEPQTEIIAEVQQPQTEAQPVEPSQAEPVVTEPVVEEQTPAQSETVANLLKLSFSDDCWIQVKDSSGKTLSTGVKKAGQTLELNGEMPYSVILGAPENVSMTLASEPVDLSGYTSGKVARFNLP